MINLHPKCPRKSTEKYQLCKILPEQVLYQSRYQTVPVRENQIKNHDYYHDNQHIWNNDHQSSSNLKVFAQIKEQKQRGEQLIHQREEMQTRDHQIMDMQRKVWVNECREKSLERLNNRKLERIGLQNLSSQKNDVFCDVTVTRPILSSGPLLGRSDLLWNQVNKQQKKQVNMLINPKILAMEEQAYETINNRINKELEAEQIEQDLKMQNIEKIRQQHIQKHQSNQLTQVKSGIALIRSDQVHRVQTAHSQKRNNIDLVEHTLQQMQSISRPFTVNSNFNETRPRLDQLSRPRQSHHFIVKNPFDRSEFKGLYLAHAAQNNDSVFNNTIKSNSHLLKDHAFERSRTSAKLQNMQTKRKPPQLFVDGDEVKEMLDSFERKLHRKTLNNDDD